MDYHAEIMAFKIDAVFAQTQALEVMSMTGKAAETFQIRLQQFLRQTPKLAQNIKLKFFRHFGQFSSTGWIEDDLEWAHRKKRDLDEMVARTGIAPVFQP